MTIHPLTQTFSKLPKFLFSQTHTKLYLNRNANGMQQEKEEENKHKRPLNTPTIAQPRSTNTTYVDPIDPTCLNLCCDVNSYS